MTPRLPQSPHRDAPPTAAERDFATLAALTALLGLAFGLLFLVGLVFPYAFFFAALLAAAALYFAAHYLVWGWLMSRLQPTADDEDSQAAGWTAAHAELANTAEAAATEALAAASPSPPPPER